MSTARAVLVAATALGALALPAAAWGAYAPKLDLRFDTRVAGAAPAVTSTMRQASGEEATRSIAARFPPGFTLNPGFAVVGCSGADVAANACTESSRLGQVDVVSMLGTATGPVHLTDDFRLFVPLRSLGFTVSVFGTIRALDDGSAEMLINDLPPVSATQARIALDGGPRAIFVNPRTCGRYTVGTRFVSHSGAAVAQSLPLDIEGCRVPPAVTSLRVTRRRVRLGARTTLSWRLAQPVRRTDVALQRMRGGVWRDLGTVRRGGAAGRHTLAVGRRWRGRALRAGRHRLVLRAIAADGGLSRARSVAFTVLARR